jgi:ribosomal protein S20
LAKTPRTWTGARTPSGLKRVRQAERRHAILQPRRTAAKTFVANALSLATTAGDSDTAAQALSDAHAALDRAAKVGAIHPNAAARRKSRLTLKFNAVAGGAHVQTGRRVTKTTSKAQATKAAKARIAVSKADKAKGAQTAAGKARAALSKTARTEAAAAAAAKAAATEAAAPKTAARSSTTKAPSRTAAAKAPAKSTGTKTAAKAKTPAKATASKAAKKPAAKS